MKREKAGKYDISIVGIDKGREKMEKECRRNNSAPIRVMWLSINPSQFEVEKTSGGWTSSLEKALKDYHGEEITLAVVYEKKKDSDRVRKTIKNNTVYYQIRNRNDVPGRGVRRPDAFEKWECIKQDILSAVEDFEPNVIQCFGSEWPYGMIAESIDTPVIIHMQGFLNEYNLTSELMPSYSLIKAGLKTIAPGIVRYLRPSNDIELEKRIMSVNRYFMGRTEWDKNIVNYFSPGAKYFKVWEAIRPEVVEAAGKWTWSHHETAKILTISQASFLKGNEIILYTARIMKEMIGLGFEWRVAGEKEYFMKTAKRIGIDPKDVGIKLLDRIPVNEVIKELSEASVFVHPSIIDNSPNAICEAQIVGCPVIASSVGGVKDLIEDNVTGFLYPYNEPYTLAFKIDTLLQSPELLARVSACGTDTAGKRHDPKTIADTVYQTYLSVCDDYSLNSR